METFKRHAISYSVTFVSMFFMLLGVEFLYHMPTEFTATTISALLMAAVRAAFKATYEYIALGKKPDLPEWINQE